MTFFIQMWRIFQNILLLHHTLHLRTLQLYCIISDIEPFYYVPHSEAAIGPGGDNRTIKHCMMNIDDILLQLPESLGLLFSWAN